MTILNCHTEMTAYHAEKVTLRRADQDEMRTRRDAGRTRLTTGLKRDLHPLPLEMASQGSYAMRTMHQDEQSDYDIDDGAYFEKDELIDAGGEPLIPRAARERVCKALQQDERLKYPAEVKDNCVRQYYPEGYHIDIPVYRVSERTLSNGDVVIVYELASGDDWVESDARAVTRWFNDYVGELNAGEADGSQRRRIIKLTKKQARSRMDWKQQTASGICITKLVVDHFVESTGRDDEALYETCNNIHQALLRSQRITHPVQTDTNLAEERDPDVLFFRGRLGEALKTLDILNAEGCTRSRARQAWDQVFNTAFFANQPGSDDTENGTKILAPFATKSSGDQRRNDDGGRFG